MGLFLLCVDFADFLIAIVFPCLSGYIYVLMSTLKNVCDDSRRFRI